MPAYTNTESGRQTHRQTSADNIALGFRPREFSCLPVADSPYRMASTIHQIWGNFLSHRIGCLPARPLASALRRLEPLIHSPLYTKPFRRVGCLPACPLASALCQLAPFYRKVFFLHQIPSCFPAGPQIYTGLSCSAWAPVLLSILPLCPGSVLFPWSRDPGRAPKCFARCPNPQAGREKASKTMQLAKKGKFITDSNQGSCRASNTVVRGQRALSRGGYPNL